MKIIFTTISLFLICVGVSAQNIFPSTGKVGIGTTSPTVPLTIKQTVDGQGIRLNAPTGTYSGNYLQLGTNAANPAIVSLWSNNRLDISSGNQIFFMADDVFFQSNMTINRLGDTNISDTVSKGSHTLPLQANLWNGTAGEITYAGFQNIPNPSIRRAHRIGIKTNARYPDMHDGIEVMSIFSDSSVGIGTTDTKHYKLAVNGAAIFTRAVVKNYSGWADYVFEKNYKLPSLHEVEQYILLNKHLPEVPTTADVEKNGVDLGDNQVMLLKKVEELTLYMIEQNKRLESQQKEIDKLNTLLRRKY